MKKKQILIYLIKDSKKDKYKAIFSEDLYIKNKAIEKKIIQYIKDRFKIDEEIEIEIANKENRIKH